MELRAPQVPIKVVKGQEYQRIVVKKKVEQKKSKTLFSSTYYLTWEAKKTNLNMF